MLCFRKVEKAIVTEGGDRSEEGTGRERWSYVGVNHLQASQAKVRNLGLFLCAMENNWIK